MSTRLLRSFTFQEVTKSEAAQIRPGTGTKQFAEIGGPDFPDGPDGRRRMGVRHPPRAQAQRQQPAVLPQARAGAALARAAAWLADARGKAVKRSSRFLLSARVVELPGDLHAARP